MKSQKIQICEQIVERHIITVPAYIADDEIQKYVDASIGRPLVRTIKVRDWYKEGESDEIR